LALGLLAPLCAQAKHAYVSNEDGDSVSVIDTDRDEVTATVEVGKRPRGLKLSRDGAQLYVAVSGLPKCPPSVSDEECAKLKRDPTADGIAVIDTQKLQVAKLLKAGSDPEQFDVSADGKRLFISNEDSGTVSVLNVATGVIEAAVQVGPEPEGVRISPNGRWVVVTSETGNAISVIDAKSLTVLASVAVGKRPRDAAFTPDSKTVYVSNEVDASLYVTTIPEAQSVMRLLQLRPEDQPMGIALDPRGRMLYVSTGRGGTVAVISLSDSKLVAEIPVGTRPWGIALARGSRKLYTANGPSDDVSIVDVATLKVVKKIPVGHSPWGIVLD
jgi:PQQ-dependent catabolism-associated beta-propeller protein